MTNNKIKILHILDKGDFGGAEKCVLSLCKNLDKDRFEVMSCFLLCGGSVNDEIEMQGYETIVLNMKNGFDLIRVLSLIFFIWKKKIDIVHLHCENPLAKLASIISYRPAIILTDHGPTLGSPLKRKKRAIQMNRLLKHFFSYVIAISKGMQNTLLEREKIPLKKIIPIYNGIDVDSIARVSCDKKKLLHELNLPGNIPVLGTVGRLCVTKQLPLLFDSLSFLKKSGAQFTFLLIGDGEQRLLLEKFAQTKGLKNCIIFLGYRKDVLELLKIIDIFVFSSGGEAFSITILEAMASKKPIVAFDVEGVNEAVVSNETGFLVPFGDTEGFAQKVKLLMDSRELLHRMERSAFERVKSLFDLKENIKKTETLYEKLIYR